jgi:hypothetical protein
MGEEALPFEEILKTSLDAATIDAIFMLYLAKHSVVFWNKSDGLPV